MKISVWTENLYIMFFGSPGPGMNSRGRRNKFLPLKVVFIISLWPDQVTTLVPKNVIKTDHIWCLVFTRFIFLFFSQLCSTFNDSASIIFSSRNPVQFSSFREYFLPEVWKIKNNPLLEAFFYPSGPNSGYWVARVWVMPRLTESSNFLSRLRVNWRFLRNWDTADLSLS